MCWFFLGFIAIFGTMVGWTLMSLTTMVASAGGIILASTVYPNMSLPADWAFVVVGSLGIFLHYALLGAKELLTAQKTLAQLQPALDKNSNQLMDASMGIVQAKRMMNFQDIDRLVKTSSDLKLIVRALSDALDEQAYAKVMELSVHETLLHVLQRFSTKQKSAIEIIGDDFQVIGNRDAFESIIFHLLDHHFGYITQGKAHKVICVLNPDHWTLMMMNHGACLTETDKQPLMDLTDSLKDNQGSPLGLVYAQHMLYQMNAKLNVQVSDLILSELLP